MGVDEVAYHRTTVVDRTDDHPGRALDYYGSRGETPLRWGGAGATRLGLSGEVNADAYEPAFGPGGFRHPATGVRLVATQRPGFELVVAAHKSVALLGVIGKADAMHSILDVETATTMGWLDDWFQQRGGRRGRVQARTATGGLTFAVTRHATSRAGDPAPHDHVLVANVVEMLDDQGGYKGLDSAALRDTVEAATMVGRLHAAWRAVELGFDVTVDDGPSGRLRHWRIVGIPDEVCRLFSKRADEIAEHLAATGQSGYRARSVAARQTRAVKRHTGTDQLVVGWHLELAAAGWPPDRLVAQLGASEETRGLRFPLTTTEIEHLAAQVLDVEGALLARHKVFTRTQLIAEVAPLLYGRDPAELDRVLEHLMGTPEVVPLIGVANAREQCFTSVHVLEAEQRIARTVEALADRPGPTLDHEAVASMITQKEQKIGHTLTDGQRAVVGHICSSRHAATVVVGVAGSGKTTALDTAASALTGAGYQVLGASTTGQAARVLATEANIDARTFASLLWHLNHATLTLDADTVVIVDEAGMASDADLARLVLAVERARAGLVLVGDHRQLDAVGPGGALAALLERRPELTVTLEDNIRQTDLAERHALAELRDGSVDAAIDWYARVGRIDVHSTRTQTLISMADAWADDIAAGRDSALLAWRRDEVDDLNRLARHHRDRLGQLQGDDITVIGGRDYAVGDRIITLAPDPAAALVTSERLTITALTAERIDARTSTGRTVRLSGDALDADHLDHGYALTVHRAQGATYQHAHVLASGGGRELAYVALSRARLLTTIHATADTLEQAADDLRTDWSHQTHQRWITDTPARLGHHPEPASTVPENEATTNAVPDPTLRSDPHRRLQALYGAYDDLQAGSGRWTHTPAGTAARARNHARSQFHAARNNAANPNVRRGERRAATKSIDALAATLNHAEQHWHDIGEPIAQELREEIRSARRETDELRVAETRQRLDRYLEVSASEPARNLGLDIGISP
jgi:conjugative relaxase-like TrwC/TraI family protein